MKKRILTLDDLVKFCKEQKLLTFSSKERGEPLCVSVPATFEKVKDADSSLLLATIKTFHTGRNRNKSCVTEDAAKKSLNTFAYKPILANFMTDEDGIEDFTSHDMEIDKDGNPVYLEHQVGCFTVDEPWTELEDDGRNFVYANAAIPREYTHAADIIERKGGTKVSVELEINQMSYNEEEDLLMLEDIEVLGLTLLGKDPDTGKDIEEGMEGARLDIADFSKQKNSVFSYEDMTSVIKEAIAQAFEDINSQRKEDNNQMNHFNELLEKYGKTVEEITFAYEGLSDEELDAAFAEAFEETPEPENPEPQGESVEFSVTYKGETKTFAKSLNDQIREITELVNATYGIEDNAWYDCEIFDDKTLIAHDWYNNKHFKQRYGNKEGNLVLKGDRSEVFVRYLTEDELTALEELKSKFEAVTKDYETVKADLDLYKAEPEKIALLESEDYSCIRKSEGFAELSKRENYFSLETEELRAKLNDMLVEFAKKFSRETKTEEKSKYECKRYGFGPVSKGNGRYGNTFAEEEN